MTFRNQNEVLIKVMKIGVCGSDIHVYHGKHPYTSYPVVQGHEVSGEIVKVGALCASKRGAIPAMPYGGSGQLH